MTTRSHDLFQNAQRHIPGGVNSPVRAFGGVGGEPLFIARAEGPFLYDVDGRRYVDFVGSWGASILGHAHPRLVAAVQQAAAAGLGFGAPTAGETRMAERLKAFLPSIDLVRLVNSGTEATMSAIRLARGFTGRDALVKFAGCYHGHADALLVKAGSGALTFGAPTSAGVPVAAAEQTVVLPYNDLEAVGETFARIGDRIACVIVEPVAGNMGCVPPIAGFLEGLRQLCSEYGSLLLFDEVMTGFRVARGGAQGLYGVTPDLTALGKVIGGGLPVGAFGGRREIMERLAPLGPVYQAGTLSGNPVTVAAGLAALELLEAPGLFATLEARVAQFTDGVLAAAHEFGIPMLRSRAGGMFGLFFTDQTAIHNLDHVTACDADRFRRFFHGMLEEGVYLAPSPFEAGFVSTAHAEAQIDAAVHAARRVLGAL